jgi:hypothetical protein
MKRYLFILATTTYLLIGGFGILHDQLKVVDTLGAVTLITVVYFMD